jgi:hypothetical protein
MGNCCAAENQREEVVIANTSTKKPKAFTAYSPGDDKMIDDILDDREVAGYSGVEKIILIEKIQSIMKGKLAR